MANYHQTKFKVGDRINDSFTLIRNFKRPCKTNPNRNE